MQLQYLDLLNSKDIEIAFRTANKGRADALLLLSGPVLNAHLRQVVDLAAKSRLPAMYNFPEFVEAGGLMTYGVNNADMARRSATYVDKILKGAKPADIPVEQPKEVRVHHQSQSRQADRINNTSERIGQSRSSNPMIDQSKIQNRKSKIVRRFPPNVLARADKVIR